MIHNSNQRINNHVRFSFLFCSGCVLLFFSVFNMYQPKILFDVLDTCHVQLLVKKLTQRMTCLLFIIEMNKL